MRRVVLAALLFVTFAGNLSAATFDRVDEARIVGRAELIVVATVESASARRHEGAVVTDYKLRVDDVVRGHAPGETLTVTELGGTADHLIMYIAGSAVYEPGTKVVAALKRRADGSYFTAFMANGVFRFRKNADGREIAVRSEDETEVAVPANELLDFARGLTSVAPQRVPIDRGSERFQPRAEGLASDYTAGGGSPSKPIRWPGCHNNCVIEFLISGPQTGVPDFPDGLGDAMGAWTGDPTSFVKLEVGGFTAATSVTADGQNMALFDNNSASPINACDGAIACGIAWANDNVSHNFDGVSFYNVIEADILFRPGAFSQNSFAAILAHEFGHGLALRHANVNNRTPFSTNAIMASPTPTNQGATLRAWDIEAMAEVYGAGVVCAPPAITGVTGGGVVQYGNRVNLVATVTGSTPITHQWYEGNAGDTSNPVGTNSNGLQTPNIIVEKKYWLKVTNECGTASSNTITVTPTECNKPQISTQPQSQRVDPNTSVTLTAASTGTTPLTYAWYEGNRGDTSKKVGSNSSSYKTPNLAATTTYWVRVSNACGQDDSAPAVITVGSQCVAPNIALQPVGGEITVGNKASLHVAAAGDAPITFQWYEGDAPDQTKPVAGATSALYEPGPFTTAGTFKYWAKATNSCGSANSNTATVVVTCGATPGAPTIAAPPIAPNALGYSVSWSGNLAVTPSFEVQEANNPDFIGAKTINVSNALQVAIPAHSEITSETRFYYRVRGIAACNQQPTPFSNATNTLVTVPLPANSTDFVIVLPEGTTQSFVQNYLVPGFGETATNTDSFSITADSPFITVFPASGALSAGGTTVQITINPGALSVGSTTGTISVVRVNGTAGRIGVNGSTTTSVPFNISLVTPVTPAPRNTTPPPGTLLIPAIAHADGIGTRFQSDIRIANAANESITYELSFTPSASDGTSTGKKTTMTIASNETKGLDDVVKAWFGSGVAGEPQVGTLEIRPLKLASGGVPNLLSTFASSRTYAISSVGTLGQFIPALPLTSFIGSIAQDSLARISLQQIAHNARYRTNVGFTEGSGAPAQILVKLLDANNSLVKSVPFSLSAYEHRQLNFNAVFGNEVSIGDGRIEVEVTSNTGKVTAYASVLDNDTTDPLLVFPVQAAKLSANKYVVPGVAELNAGSNFHTDMRLYNAGAAPVVVTMLYKPQRGDSTPVPDAVTRTIGPGQILAIDNVLPTLWNLNASGGAVTVSSSNNAPLVITARTFSREADGGTYGQFIPAVTAADAVGLGDRALEVLQLEDSGTRSLKTGFRSNLGLVEVTGNRAVVELTLRPPDSKLTAVAHVELQGNEFVQIQEIFRFAGFTNVYNGRVSVKVVEGLGRVAGYGSVVDNKTEDPTYVPSQ
jgi:Ig-like domain CHU_C associated